MTGDHGHHHQEGHHRSASEYVRDFANNWGEYEGPISRKVWLTLRNRARSVSPPFRGCCGHPGEPGC